MDFLFIVLAIVITLALLGPKKKITYKSPWKNPEKENFPLPPPIEKPSTFDKKDQLSITLNNKYEKKRMLNKTEEEVYKIILRMIYLHAKGQYKINMQTSLGEILKSSPDGHKTINCKRVDFCIVDREFIPVAVIEVNGTGHYQGDALLRDETKRTAIECAGIKYIAIRENENVTEKLNKELKLILNQFENSAATIKAAAKPPTTN